MTINNGAEREVLVKPVLVAPAGAGSVVGPGTVVTKTRNGTEQRRSIPFRSVTKRRNTADAALI